MAQVEERPRIEDNCASPWLYAVRHELVGRSRQVMWERRMGDYLTCTREAVRSMRARGGGQIVNIGSLSAKVREEGADVYVATKSAIEGISESFRKQLAEENIAVGLIEPGLVGTNLPSDDADTNQQLNAEASGDMLEAEDIAGAVFYILTQPPRTSILQLRIAPIKQAL